MDSLKDDNVQDILLSLPSWASLGHAVLASDRFRRIASSPDFLRRFRARHASSSPRSFLGVFAQREYRGLPVFQLAGSARSDPGLVAVARSGDFLLAGLEDDPFWRIDDCRNGHLLLYKDRSAALTIYDPISLRRTDISPPQNNHFPSFTVSCLLNDGDGSFRVVTLQVDSCRRFRAVEYDSRLHEWRYHPWAADANRTSSRYHAMYAAGLIFFVNDGSTDSSLILDTSTMEFSMLPLPATITRYYSVGETEDGKCCLVWVRNGLLQVWLLMENRKWEFEKERPLRELLAGEYYCDKYRVKNVAAGIVIVWAGSEHFSVGDKYHHYAIDLKNLCVKAKICEGGEVVYPFHLPWPPAGLTLPSEACFR
jgi:hypothetical protein